MKQSTVILDAKKIATDYGTYQGIWLSSLTSNDN